MGDGWASPLSPSPLSKGKKAIRHLRHHHDYICDDVMFRLLRNNIPVGFYSQGDTPWSVWTGLQASVGDWKQLQLKTRGCSYVRTGCYFRDACISTRNGCIIPCRQWYSHQDRLHPTGSLQSAINYNCDPYQYITGLWKPQLACQILPISALQGCWTGRCLSIT